MGFFETESESSSSKLSSSSRSSMSTAPLSGRERSARTTIASSHRSGSGPTTAPQPALSTKERLAEIRRLQEFALASLPANGLFIVLYTRHDPPRLNDFHWGLYFHKSGTTGGTKYHIRNMSAGWMTDHGSTRGVFKSNFLCVLVQIATIPSQSVVQTDAIIRSKDGEINQISGVTCRVWLMEIVATLRRNGLVKCNDVNALQDEVFQTGNSHSVSATKNDQPRPVTQSRLCQL